MKSIVTVLLLAGALIAPATAQAQDFPNKPVTVIIPFTPGASNDLIGRYLADGLSKMWKQPVVVENRPGAGSAIGTAHVVKSKPDGYTLLFISSSLTTNAATQTNLPFDPLKDLKAVGQAAIGQMIAVTGSRISLPNLAEVAKQSKSQKVFYASTGPGSAVQFSAELFNDVAGIKMEAVNYRGATEALVDVAGGRVDIYFGTVTTVLPSLANKTATAVAVASKTRSKTLPDVPTVAEAGFPGAESDLWWGVFVPAATPPDVIAKIHDSMTAVMNTKEATEFLEKQGAIPGKMATPEFQAQVASDLQKWKALATKHNITAN